MGSSVVLDLSQRQLLICYGAPTAALIAVRCVLLAVLWAFPGLGNSALLRAPTTPIGLQVEPREQAKSWKTYVLAGVAGVSAAAWLVASVLSSSRGYYETALGEAIAGGGWVYACMVPLLRPPTTPSYTLFTIYLLHLISSGLGFISLSLHHSGPILARSLVLFITTASSLVLIGVTLSLPMTDAPPPEDTATFLASPEDRVSLWAWITFTWVGSLLDRSAKGKLEYSDIWKLAPVMQAQGVRATARGFSKAKLGLGQKLIPLVARLNSLDLSLSLSLGFLSSFLAYTSPYFLKQILDALTPDETGAVDPALRKSAYIYASLALIAQVLRAEVDLQQLWHERRCIVRTRSLLMGIVYEKALKRRDASGVVLAKATVPDAKDADKKPDAGKAAPGKKASGSAGSTGKIVQLMSSDAMRVANQLMSLSSFVAAPFELVVAITFLYQLLGWTCLAGLSVMAISLPLNHILVKKRIKIHRSVLASRDARMDILNEFIQSIRFVKYSASEPQWLERVFSARTVELGWLLKTRLNSLIINVIWNFTPDLISLISFICFTKVLKQELTVPVAFTSLALFALARSPMNSLPSQITGMLETYVSVQRLEAFLEEPEVEAWVSGLRPDEDGPTLSDKVGIEDGVFRYQDVTTKHAAALPSSPPALAPLAEDLPADGQPAFELRASVDFPIGKLSVVVGATGSGKTSLFLALMGEMDCISGTVNLSKEVTRVDPETGLYAGVSYCSQLPWLQGTSIKNNILFGSPFDESRYSAVLDACSLRVDLGIFPAGDETEIGEKGITLSGGQKARVALARAAYSRAAIVLLDDPLSAVDNSTGRHLYTQLIKGPLFLNRTIILATHHLSLVLPGAEYLVKMSAGDIVHAGLVSHLDDELVASDLLDEKASLDAEEPVVEPTVVESVVGTRSATPVVAIAGAIEVVAAPKKQTGDGKLIEEEARATGRVKLSVYNTYLSAAGWDAWILIFALILIGRVARVGDRVWFKLWGESYRSQALQLFPSLHHSLAFQTTSELFLASNTTSGMGGFFDSFPSATDDVNFYLYGYAAICVANILIAVLGILAGYYGSFRAARILFRRTLTTISKAPFRYWDTTPTGRILNRFSTDFQIIDTSLTDQVRVVLTQLFSFVVNVAVIALVSPSFIPPALVIITLYFRLSASYIRASRDLRRLESNARSPIYSKFGETLAGIVTCRAFSAERKMMQGLFDSVDTMLSVHYSSAMVNRYLLWRFDCLGAIAVGITTYLALASGASPGLAALAITSAQSLVSSVYWMCRWVAALEVDLNAVERVTELLATPQEPPSIVDSNRPPAYWPSSTGGISFEKLTLSYAPHLPPVINNVSFEVGPREKVGLIGRTGSGKTTLGMSLLRFVDPTSGRILIDGIDITTIGLQDLRSRLTLIPQEAVLFNGTVRSNIDPFNEFSDAACNEALERVHMNVLGSLATSGTATPVGEGEAVGQGRLGVTLATPVSQGGNNFSAGQRQLLAMARALLRRSVVIIMDEATASVDFETDAKIQETIRVEFAESLVFTIAHRLRTVIDYDKILVLDAGSLVEFDSPRNLLLNPTSAFRLMCEQAADWEDLKLAAGI